VLQGSHGAKKNKKKRALGLEISGSLTKSAKAIFSVYRGLRYRMQNEEEMLQGS
jgi:hypothetical protein